MSNENKTQQSQPAESGENDVKLWDAATEWANKNLPSATISYAAGHDGFIHGAKWQAAQSPSTSGEKLYREVKEGEPSVKRKNYYCVVENTITGHRYNEIVYMTESGFDIAKPFAVISYLEPYTPLPDAGRDGLSFINWITEEGYEQNSMEKWFRYSDPDTRLSNEELYALFSSRPVQVSEEQAKPDLGVCKRCKKRPANTDYNGHGHYVCEHCDKMLNDEFEREYQ